MSRAFAVLLRAFRLGAAGRSGANRFGPARPCLSQNQLARRSGVDPAYINRLERNRSSGWRGTPPRPSLAVVEHLADALDVSAMSRARLLVAAGYWPWPDLDDDTLAVLLGCALALTEGDDRLLQDAVPIPLRMGATLEAR